MHAYGEGKTDDLHICVGQISPPHATHRVMQVQPRAPREQRGQYVRYGLGVVGQEVQAAPISGAAVVVVEHGEAYACVVCGLAWWFESETVLNPPSSRPTYNNQQNKPTEPRTRVQDFVHRVPVPQHDGRLQRPRPDRPRLLLLLLLALGHRCRWVLVAGYYCMVMPVVWSGGWVGEAHTEGKYM